MTRFLARRLLNYIVLLVLASFLTFALTSISFKPLDSLESRNPRPPQAVIEAKRAELNLDKPIPLRYVHWASGAVRGDFGTTDHGPTRLRGAGAPRRGQPAAARHRCGARHR